MSKRNAQLSRTTDGNEKVRREDCREKELLRPGQELIVTRWIALAGTALIADRYEEELKKRFPFSLVDAAKRFADSDSAPDEAQVAARCFGGCALYALSQGGILGALWEAAEQAKVGLEVDLRRIPIRQETVEICEYFDVNPYYLYSAGALLIGTDHAGELTETLIGAGIPAAVIGHVIPGRKRIIRNGEKESCLNRPQPDEWCRRFGAWPAAGNECDDSRVCGKDRTGKAALHDCMQEA